MAVPAVEAGRPAGASSIGTLLGPAIERLRAAGSEQPRLDAELLLGHAAGLGRTAIIAHPERVLDAPTAARFEAFVARRGAGEPVAYIRGRKEFHGLAFGVDRRVLIPRPETERLVELAIAAAAARLDPAGSPDTIRIVDVGTGSGAVIVAVAVALRQRRLLDRVRLVATDRSAEALAVAATNVAAHDLVTAVELVPADLLPPDPLPPGDAPFDLVLANLPYIPSAEVPRLPIAAAYEPRLALDGGPDGLTVIRRLLAHLPASLASGGLALLEIGADQAAAMGEAVGAILPGWSGHIEPDLSGLPRVAVVEPTNAGRGDAAPIGDFSGAVASDTLSRKPASAQ